MTNIWHIDWESATRNKEEVDGDDSETLPLWGFIVRELQPIKATRKLGLVRLRASKELPEAHFQFLQVQPNYSPVSLTTPVHIYLHLSVQV